ncbi:orotate phosphoribosyltransferase [Bdellovibrionota bacterium FG-2]
MDSKTHQLAHLIRKLSYHEGEFVLSSGLKSSLYVDLKATTLHPEGAALIAEIACDLILEKGMELEGVGGLTLGADPLATALSLEARKRGLFWPAFIVRKEPKGHGTSRYIEGSENLKVGARLLVLEDVVTTGASSLRAIERLRDSGFSPIAALTVVDREQPGRIAIESAGVKFLRLLTIGEVRAADVSPAGV